MDIKRNQNIRTDSINTTINLINFFGWSLTLISVTCSLLFSKIDEIASQKFHVFALFLLKLIQTFQISDILLGFANTGSLPILSIMQIFGRLFTTWGFMKLDNSFVLNFLIMFCWSLADSVRILYYMMKDNQLLGWLRYNLFIVNYPIGFGSELILMEMNIWFNNYDWKMVYFIRFIEISFILGFVFLYKHLLKNRKNYFKKKIY
jgi:hypothetical protein